MSIQQKRLLLGLLKIGLWLLAILALTGASIYLLLLLYHASIMGGLGLAGAVSMLVIGTAVIFFGTLLLVNHFKPNSQQNSFICPTTTAMSVPELTREIDRVRIEKVEADALLGEFRRQNAEISRGLDHADDPRYTPTDATPHEFICPITQQIMRQPVEVEPGRSYEYVAIKRWHDLGHNTTPVTRQALADPHITGVNTELRIRIAEYILRLAEGAIMELDHSNSRRTSLFLQ